MKTMSNREKVLYLESILQGVVREVEMDEDEDIYSDDFYMNFLCAIGDLKQNLYFAKHGFSSEYAEKLCNRYRERRDRLKEQS